MAGAALEEAIRSYRAALTGMAAEDQAGRAEMLRKLGECLWMVGQLPVALAALADCSALYERLGNRIGAGAVQRLFGRLYWEQGERATSVHHYQQALESIEREPESIELARAVSAISQMHMLASEYEQAIAWGERTLALARRLDAKDVIVHALNNIGVALMPSSNAERGLALLKDSLNQALDLNSECPGVGSGSLAGRVAPARQAVLRPPAPGLPPPSGWRIPEAVETYRSPLHWKSTPRSRCPSSLCDSNFLAGPGHPHGQLDVLLLANWPDGSEDLPQ
jgi:tetratricopeptide (TPR) repeat protein